MSFHSSALRYALMALMAAMGLPLLVVCTANVRHRQLQSKSNPRWQQFAKINSWLGTSKESSSETPQLIRAASTTTSNGRLNVTARLTSRLTSTDYDGELVGSATGALSDSTSSDLASSNGTSSNDTEPRFDEPSRSQTTTNSSGHSELALRAERNDVQTPSVLEEGRDSERPSRRETSSPRMTYDRRLPDEPSPTPYERVLRSRPLVEFRSIPEPITIIESRPGNEATERRLETQLNELQQRIDRLATNLPERTRLSLEDVAELIALVQQRKSATSPTHTETNASASPPAKIEPISEVPAVIPPTPVETALPNEPAPPDAESLKKSAVPRGASIQIDPATEADQETRHSIRVTDEEVSRVLEALGRAQKMNLVSSESVIGRISLDLNDITLDGAMEAVLKSRRLVAERLGEFLFIRTESEVDAERRERRDVTTKLFRPQHIGAADLLLLIDPLMTPGLGRHALASHRRVVGADQPASHVRDVLLIRDTPDVISRIESLVQEIDVAPSGSPQREAPNVISPVPEQPEPAESALPPHSLVPRTIQRTTFPCCEPQPRRASNSSHQFLMR